MKTYQTDGEVTVGATLIVRARSLKEAKEKFKRGDIDDADWGKGRVSRIRALGQPSEAEKAASTNSD